MNGGAERLSKAVALGKVVLLVERSTSVRGNSTHPSPEQTCSIQHHTRAVSTRRIIIIIISDTDINSGLERVVALLHVSPTSDRQFWLLLLHKVSCRCASTVINPPAFLQSDATSPQRRLQGNILDISPLTATNRDGSSHYFPPEASTTTRAEDPRVPIRPLTPQIPEPPPSAQSRASRRLNVSSFFPQIPRLIPASSRTPEPPNLWNPVNASIRQPTPAQHAFQHIPRRLEPRDEYSRFSESYRQRESGNQSRSSLQVQASEISRISSNTRPRAQYSKAFSPKGKEPAYLSEPPMAAPPLSSTPSITKLSPPNKDLARSTPNTPKPITSAPSPERPWGPTHPCFPHINAHVPLTSPLIKTTRIIRIKRDWMIAGDLAPTFSNVYPEILDPWVSEQDFRVLIQRINEGLLQAFNPLGWRAWVDAVLGIATAWLWEDLGFTGAKSGVRGVEAFIERWNAEKSGKDAEAEVRIIPLRRTGYLSVSGGAFYPFASCTA